MSFSSNNHPIPRHPSSLSLKGLLNSNLRKEIFGPQACLGLAGLAHACLLPSPPIFSCPPSPMSSPQTEGNRCLPMMRQSLPPAMNMDSVLEGRLKCRAARKGESRSAGSEETEWLRREGAAAASGALKDAGLVNSGCLMTTHS